MKGREGGKGKGREGSKQRGEGERREGKGGGRGSREVGSEEIEKKVENGKVNERERRK